jgi:hypothetical protein
VALTAEASKPLKIPVKGYRECAVKWRKISDNARIAPLTEPIYCYRPPKIRAMGQLPPKKKVRSKSPIKTPKTSLFPPKKTAVKPIPALIQIGAGHDPKFKQR